MYIPQDSPLYFLLTVQVLRCFYYLHVSLILLAQFYSKEMSHCDERFAVDNLLRNSAIR